MEKIVNKVTIMSIEGAYGWINDNGDYLVCGVKGTSQNRGFLKALISIFSTYKFLHGYEIYSIEPDRLENILASVFDSSPSKKHETIDLLLDLQDMVSTFRKDYIDVKKTVVGGTEESRKLMLLLNEARRI
jgi:hypothetical protein